MPKRVQLRAVCADEAAGVCRPARTRKEVVGLVRRGRLIEYLPVKLKEMPFCVQLFKIVATNGDIEWVITNHPHGTFTTTDIQEENAHRWQIEQRHRELKQLTGSEKCECRKARSQRNHLACCYHAWLSLKVIAKRLGKSLYAVRQNLFADYLRAELRHPHIPAFLPI